MVKGPQCKHEGCSGGAKYEGMCQRHGLCETPGCTTASRTGGHCIAVRTTIAVSVKINILTRISFL